MEIGAVHAFIFHLFRLHGFHELLGVEIRSDVLFLPGDLLELLPSVLNLTLFKIRVLNLIYNLRIAVQFFKVEYG